MSKIKNRGLDQYGTRPFEQQQFGTAGVEGVNNSVAACWYCAVDEIQCLSDQWRCEDRLQCIPKEFVCNGEHDCNDGSDEIACGISRCLLVTDALIVISL